MCRVSSVLCTGYVFNVPISIVVTAVVFLVLALSCQ